MATTVSRMTKEELRKMIEATVEQKLLELLGDPDEGLTIKKSLKERLIRQRKAVASGQRGQSFPDAVRHLELD